MKQLKYILLVALFLGQGSAAHATRNVSSPTVEKGIFNYEARFGLEFDDRERIDHRLKQTYYVEYGFTDWYVMRLVGRFTKPEGQDNDLTSLDWEHRLQFFKEKRDGFDGGVKLVYSHADDRGDANALQLQFLGQKKFNKFKNKANIIFEREVGANASDGLILALSAQSIYAVDDKFSAGAEWFADIGALNQQSGLSNQRHQAGPVFTYKLTPSLFIETGYLVGLTDPTSDGLLKFFLKGKF